MDFEEQSMVPGSIPEYGAIFMSNNETRRECLRKKVFALPSSQAYFVEHVKVGMVLFLFEFERRELHGVFLACSDGAMNIVPHAFSSLRKQFPAQVKFSLLWDCNPLSEKEFCEAIRENYFSPKKFRFGLSEQQVRKLLYLFSKKKLESQGPPRQLSGGRFLRGRGHANHRFRQVASSNRSFRKDQVISGHKSHKFGQTFPTMCPEYSYCNYERSSGPYDRKEQAVGVGNIDEQDCGHSLAAKLNFGYEHQEESPFTPTFSDTYFEDPLADLGVCLDARRLVAVSGSSDKQWNVESPVKLNLSAKYPSDNFRRAPEDFRTKGNDWFEDEDYQENLSILPQSRAFPSFSSQKLNTSPPSSKYSMEDDSFKHDPAVPSMLSQQTLYEDAVVTTTLPYNPDAPYLHNRNSPSVGVMHHLGSFPPSDNNHAGLAVPTDNQSVPSYSSSLMLTNVGTRSRNCIADLYDKRHDNKTSLAESLSYKIRATEILNEGYDDFSYMEPSLPCTFSETIHDMVKSDKVSLYSAQHEVLGPSVTFGRHSAASRDTFDKNLPAYGRNVKFEADSLMLKSYPKSLDLHRSNLLDPSVHKDSESPYSGHRQASVFSRLSLAPKVRKEKKYHLLSNADTLDASVDELMAMLHHNNQHWGKARCNLVAKVNPAESFKRKREAMFNSKETTDLSKSTSMKMETEGSSEIDDNKSDNPNGVPFVDFRRRNRASKDLCDRLSASSSRIAQEDDPSVGQQKRRKLVRPNFSKNEACENWDTCNSFQIENVSQVHGSPSHILTRAMEDSIHHDNENKVSLVVGSPHVRHGICTVDENFGSQTKQVESRASLGRSAEGKVLSSEQQKRRRLVRPNFDESKEPQERDMYLSAKMEPTPIAKCPVSEDNIGSAMVSVNCIKGDTSEDGKFSHLLCPSDPKGTIVDSQEQTVVSPGACFLTDGERNVLPENGCA